jgi:uncharacterized protein
MIRIYYHKADLDGICSAAILYVHHGGNVVLYPMDYSTKLDWSEPTDRDQVYIVDFSLKPEDMYKMVRQVNNLVWIDHHHSAIQDFEEYRRNNPNTYRIAGVQRTGPGGKGGDAACLLVWTYIHPDEVIPKSVQYLSQYDVWNHKDIKTLWFQFGMRVCDLQPYSPRWEDILRDRGIADILRDGELVMTYDSQLKRRAVSRGAFLTRLADRVVLACNASGGSDVFNSAPEFLRSKAEALVTFIYDGVRKEWVYGIYENPDKPGLDVSAIAKLFGGGGHAGAAGFSDKKEMLTACRMS